MNDSNETWVRVVTGRHRGKIGKVVNRLQFDKDWWLTLRQKTGLSVFVVERFTEALEQEEEREARNV